ncbi:MAG: hypothetical protein WC797_01550 [Candidatus Paceibacterota bacterium]|jgi:hypothetical protein
MSEGLTNLLVVVVPAFALGFLWSIIAVLRHRKRLDKKEAELIQEVETADNEETRTIRSERLMIERNFRFDNLADTWLHAICKVTVSVAFGALAALGLYSVHSSPSLYSELLVVAVFGYCLNTTWGLRKYRHLWCGCHLEFYINEMIGGIPFPACQILAGLGLWYEIILKLGLF